MGGNRTLLIVVIFFIFIIGAGVIGYLVWQGGSNNATPTVEPTPLVEYTNIVVAVQNIPRGMTIRAENMAVELQEWPNDHLPFGNYYTSIEEVEGRMARTDIPLGIPIMADMIVKPGDTLAAEGSAAAIFSPQDRVAYAIPMDIQGGVAWAIRPGDHVDVVAAVKLMPMDPEFQTQLPNSFYTLPDTPEESTTTGIYGRFEVLPNGQSALIYPTGALEPNLVVQLTVQDAIVWNLGIWEDADQHASSTTAAAAPAAASDATGGTGGLIGGQPTPTPLPQMKEYREVEPVTLLVKRDEMLVLKYLYEIGADLDLALRPAGFTEPVMQTQPVWLRYVVDKYQLPDTPPDLPIVPVTLHPPLTVEPVVTEAPQE